MIVVLTTPRSGSTFICNRLAKQHGYKYLGEVFNLETSKSKILKIIESCNSNDTALLKIFPNNVNTMILNGCLKKSKKVYIHSRKDFNAQCKSFYISMLTETWHADKVDLRNITYDAALYEAYQQYLMRSYLEIKRIKELLNNVEVSYLEDFYSLENRYQQPVVWDIEPPTINFDVEKLFND